MLQLLLLLWLLDVGCWMLVVGCCVCCVCCLSWLSLLLLLLLSIAQPEVWWLVLVPVLLTFSDAKTRMGFVKMNFSHLAMGKMIN